jgi:hypothetical protein
MDGFDVRYVRPGTMRRRSRVCVHRVPKEVEHQPTQRFLCYKDPTQNVSQTRNTQRKKAILPPRPFRPLLHRHILNLARPPHIPIPHRQPDTPPRPLCKPRRHILLFPNLAPTLDIRPTQQVPINVREQRRRDHAVQRIMDAPFAGPLAVQGLAGEEQEDGESEPDTEGLVRGADGEGEDVGEVEEGDL